MKKSYIIKTRVKHYPMGSAAQEDTQTTTIQSLFTKTHLEKQSRVYVLKQKKTF